MVGNGNRGARRSRGVPDAVNERREPTNGGCVIEIRNRYVLMERFEGEAVILEEILDHLDLVVEIVFIHFTETVLNGICVRKLDESKRERIHLHQEDPQKDGRQYSCPREICWGGQRNLWIRLLHSQYLVKQRE